MKKLPVILTSAAICGFAAFATMPTAYAAEDGTPEKAAEIAQRCLDEQVASGDEQSYLSKQPYHVGNWCVRFAMYCITQAGGEVTGVSPEESSTTSAVVDMYAADSSSYHPWVGEYWSYDDGRFKKNPTEGYTEDDYTPQVGDLVFFDKGICGDEVGPGPDHTGLVVAVEGTGKNAIVSTIEGNMSSHIIPAKYQNGKPIDGDVEDETVIVGFGTPKYPNKSTSSNPSESSDNSIPESPITASDHSRQRAIEQACMRMNKSRRNTDYSHTSIAFVDEVLKASGAKSFYNFPDEPHVTDFVKDYKANGAFFEFSSSYVPRVGDVVAIENDGDSSNGADQLGIISGVNFEGGKKEVYTIKYDPKNDRVRDSELCTDTIVGYCVPFYEYDDLGDVTYDGKVDAKDAEKVMDIVSANETSLAAYVKLCADVNKNGTVNRIDISELQRKLSKQVLLEPETDQLNIVGKKESDRITATVEDETGYMVYGPYIKGLAEGDKEVTFRMKTDNNSADNDVVARIEVNDPDLGAIIASKEIRRKDFLTPDAFQDFLLEYESSSISNRVEYRVYYFKKAYIAVDRVTVKDVKTKTDMVFEAETDLSSKIRKKGTDGKYGRDGIEALVGDGQGYLAYGPYVDKLALGSFRADFSLKVDNNTIDGDVLRIEVYNRTKDKVITQRTLKCTDFETANFTQVFPLYFNNGQLNDVYEFRAVYLGNSETIIDKVSVVHLDKNLANGFGLDSMKMADGCNKEDKAIVLSNQGDIVYGPYTDKVSLGSNTAMFKAAITDDGSADDVVAVFDVFTTTNDNFFVKKELKGSEISSDGYYRFRFDLPAEYADSKLEFRVTATGKATIKFEKVIITADKNTVPSKVVTRDIDPSDLNTTSRKVLMSGVDVSENQPNINWTALKNNGIDYAILRIGIRGQGTYIVHEDPYFEDHYRDAKNSGMLIGGYWFISATNVKDAKEELEACLKYIEGKEFDFPVYLDVEDPDLVASDDLSEIIITFCDGIKAAGYTPGLYANLETLRTVIDSSLHQKYALWVAQYNNEFDYYGAAGMWQKSQSSKMNGINGAVDLDYCYVDYPSIIGK